MSAHADSTWPRRITVVVDHESWILPWAETLVDRCREELGDDATLCRDYGDVPEGTVAFFLGCTGLAPREVLARNRYNLVVHESAVPEGRGFAPLTWQVLEGRDRIPITLLEATDEPDAGVIYAQRVLELEGHELHDELRAAQGRMTLDMCLDFLRADTPPAGVPQEGAASWYRKRTPEDSRLDPQRPLAEQFDLLRVVDNERYPAFFDMRGHRYILRIEKAKTTVPSTKGSTS